jgi:hypothetical protein
MNPIFISFYSGDIYYENCSKVLYNKCKSLGIEIEIERSGGHREYWKNTLHKPFFIYDKLNLLKRDLIWIDVDTNISEYHGVFKKWDSDILFASHTGDLQGIKASPLCIKYNERSLRFLESLKNTCLEKIRTNDVDFDHDVLKYDILPKFKGKLWVDIMKGEGFINEDFSDGKIISNGISKVRDKGIYMREVIRKNGRRESDFISLTLNDFNL